MAKSKKPKDTADEDDKFPLPPQYDAKDDIYAHEKKVRVKPEENENSTDLDVPGAELDDKDEAIGEEDEENNYYSLGGDEHNDLEEEKE